jgi:NitT/TauT family transport system ATP-binding protein
LNAIAAQLAPDEVELSGSISIDGRDARSFTLRELNLGYVFQRDNLLPWRTIEENVRTGLEVRGTSRTAQRARARELIQMAGLDGFERYYPHQVSGGMRQRTSLIRTLAYDPRLILMDEPFGALDAQTRMLLQAELLRIWERTRTTIVFVTHDLSEAILLAQRVILLSTRPATVRREYAIDLTYPRDPFELRGDPRFGVLETSLWQTLREDFQAAVPSSR